MADIHMSKRADMDAAENVCSSTARLLRPERSITMSVVTLNWLHPLLDDTSVRACEGQEARQVTHGHTVRFAQQ